MPRFAVLAALLLSGCAQLFGLDETTGASARLGVQRVSIGASLVTSPQDLSALTASYLVADDADPTGLARIAAAQAELGTWTAPVRAAAPVLFTLPDYPMPIARLFDFPHPTLSALFGVMEHPDPQPAPPGAMLNVSVMLDAPHTAADSYLLYTVGTWNQLGVPPPAVGAAILTGAVALPMNSTITGRPQEKITVDDAVVALRYNANQLRAAAIVPPFDQTGTDMLAGTLAPVTLEAFTVKIDQAAANARFAAVRPAIVGTPATNWSLRAAPGSSLANENGPLLNAGGPTDPTTISFMAGNPFTARGWTSTMVLSVQATRTYTPTSMMLPATLVAGLLEKATPTPAGLQMNLPAGLPTRISLNGTLLVTDGITIAKPTRAVEVSFEADVAANTMFQLQLFRLVPNAAMMPTALVIQSKLAASGAAPRFVLPPELFEPGGLYTLRAGTVQGGFPGLPDGDLTLRELPIAQGFLDSGVFEVLQ